MRDIETDDEVLEFAIAREVDAYHFYLALSARSKFVEMKAHFENFAKEELEHKAKLELEVMKMGRVVAADEKALDMKGEYDHSDGKPELDMDYIDAVALSIEKEEVSFRTYVSLAGLVQDSGSREMLLALAEEEVKHKLRWETEYDNLQQGR